MISGIDHVQIAMPPGEEQAARDFYGGILGLEEIAKPPELAKRGGVWFQAAGFQIHLGVMPDFLPARKAHPGFRVRGLDALQSVMESAGYTTTADSLIPGTRRFFSHDPFGNRLEFQEEET